MLNPLLLEERTPRTARDVAFRLSGVELNSFQAGALSILVLRGIPLSGGRTLLAQRHGLEIILCLRLAKWVSLERATASPFPIYVEGKN